MNHVSRELILVVTAQRRAVQMAEERGWSPRTLGRVTGGLRRVLTGVDDGPVTATLALERLTAAHSRVRVFEVLADLGLLEDDRESSTRAWIESRCAELPAGFHTDVRDWLIWLLTGDARTRPREATTAYVYFGKAKPVLKGWSASHERLREITRADVTAALDLLRGRERFNTALALKSLFRFAAKHRRVFANPTAGLSVPRGDVNDHLPLTDEEITAIEHTATSPAQRLAIALAAVHAARGETIRRLTLEDVDLARDRIVLSGQRRPLGELVRATLLDYLAERRDQWPHTANRHVVLSKQTANGTEPVSTFFIKRHLTLRGISLERIRIDRCLHEALATRADALHLAVLFDLHPSTAARYAACARQILHDPADSTPMNGAS